MRNIRVSMILILGMFCAVNAFSEEASYITNFKRKLEDKLSKSPQLVDEGFLAYKKYFNKNYSSQYLIDFLYSSFQKDNRQQGIYYMIQYMARIKNENDVMTSDGYYKIPQEGILKESTVEYFDYKKEIEELKNKQRNNEESELWQNLTSPGYNYLSLILQGRHRLDDIAGLIMDLAKEEFRESISKLKDKKMVLDLLHAINNREYLNYLNENILKKVVQEISQNKISHQTFSVDSFHYLWTNLIYELKHDKLESIFSKKDIKFEFSKYLNLESSEYSDYLNNLLVVTRSPIYVSQIIKNKASEEMKLWFDSFKYSNSLTCRALFRTL